jgi:hypothetical protein
VVCHISQVWNISQERGKHAGAKIKKPMNKVDTDTQLERQFAATLQSEPETWTSDCLDPERILALAEHTLPEAEATPFMAHIALCARCRREYAETVELIQLSDEVRLLEAQTLPPVPVSETKGENLASTPTPERRKTGASGDSERSVAPPEPRRLPFWRQWFSPGLGFALGAAAAGALLFYAALLPVRKQAEHQALALKEREEQLLRVAQEKEAQMQELTELKQQGQGEASRLGKELNHLKAKTKEQGIQIAQLKEESTLLQEMPLPRAEWLTAGESGRLRGGNGEPDSSLMIKLLRPVNAAVRDATPTFEVRPLPGVTDYQISLEQEGSLEEVPAPKQLSATRWQVTTPLEPGKVYQWAVTAQRGQERLRSPMAKFLVLTLAQQREIEEGQTKYAGKPLLLGALYARLGLREEAEQQFRAALKANPNQTTAKRWLKESQEQP